MITDPVAEYQLISQWMAQHIDTTTTPQRLVQKLSIYLNRQHPTQITLEETTVLDVDDLTIAAVYDPWLDEEQRKPLILFFMINHAKTQDWLITNDVAQSIAIELIEALVHKYQHMHQYRSRNFILPRPYFSTAVDPELKYQQEYLGQMDEIDAYAVNIAVRQYIRKDPQSLDLVKYYRVFGADHWIVRRLLKKINKRLAYLESIGNRCTSTEI